MLHGLKRAAINSSRWRHDANDTVEHFMTIQAVDCRYDMDLMLSRTSKKSMHLLLFFRESMYVP